MDGLGILLREVLEGIVPSLHQRVAQALRGGHIGLLELEFVGRERRGEIRVVLDVAGDGVGVGRQRVRLGRHICQMGTTAQNRSKSMAMIFYCTRS